MHARTRTSAAMAATPFVSLPKSSNKSILSNDGNPTAASFISPSTATVIIREIEHGRSDQQPILCVGKACMSSMHRHSRALSVSTPSPPHLAPPEPPPSNSGKGRGERPSSLIDLVIERRGGVDSGLARRRLAPTRSRTCIRSQCRYMWELVQWCDRCPRIECNGCGGGGHV